MASLSSILAWRISWTEEPGRLQSSVVQTRTLPKLFHKHAGESQIWKCRRAESKIPTLEPNSHSPQSKPVIQRCFSEFLIVLLLNFPF